MFYVLCCMCLLLQEHLRKTAIDESTKPKQLQQIQIPIKPTTTKPLIQQTPDPQIDKRKQINTK
eukprot:m.91006 g.91006  ORF g.91006 m.91006 type:complete len:64 (-) comp26440_c1_seq4:781-972(-)